MSGRGRTLRVLPGRYGVCRLAPDEPVPGWFAGPGLRSLVRTDAELSLVCDASRVPRTVRCERGWRGLRVDGTLEFSEVGVLAGLTTVLAAAGVSVLALSTFDTDYLFVREGDLARALDRLAAAGYTVRDGAPGRDATGSAGRA